MQSAGFVRMNVSPPSGTDKSEEEPTPMMRRSRLGSKVSGANLWNDDPGSPKKHFDPLITAACMLEINGNGVVD